MEHRGMLLVTSLVLVLPTPHSWVLGGECPDRKQGRELHAAWALDLVQLRAEVMVEGRRLLHPLPGLWE